MKILVIIPAYNEEASILDVVTNLKTVRPDVDYLVVNDCSKDSTRKICHENHLNYISFPCNLGIGGAVQAGYIYAMENEYDIAIQMDGDGQHDPAFIDVLTRPILDGQTDMVIGSRFITKDGFQSSAMRRFGIKFIKLLLKLLCGADINDTTSGFRATSAAMTRFFSTNYAQDYPEPEAIIAAVLGGYRLREVPVVMQERQGGESSIRAFKSINYMIKVSIAVFVYRLGHRKHKEKKK